ncbi:TIGR02281 family clan AA aspartic protease [Sinorhizobium sp. 7-81]|uniref:retropepsin-like aspartic protease family protein n=1 Tax=Sinorhizobium sp. 8-89 TaxID=3049089 RepID=UPI0024C334AE|nr:TIGR02281 family clan AA aspartic protease [Sinorhizobium sp. 8-89]MDK1492370.1 TIGR02281 family clan AA aspartic protease [Sinorhizobium sp. 8-89]
MITRLLAIVGGLALVALVVSDLASSYLERQNETTTQGVPRAAPVTAAKYASGKSIVLEADAAGHFFGTFRINGRSERGLVDTGASTIAINVSAARRFGISVGSLAFNARAQTANGIVEAAYVRLDRVEIGSIALKGVDAMVLPDKALSGMLVGMSFLSRLSSYRAENGALHLVR